MSCASQNVADEDAIGRAVSYLYTKETPSSFDIEGEHPSASRTERYVSPLRAVPNVATLTHEELLRLQNATVDLRYADHIDGTMSTLASRWTSLARGSTSSRRPRATSRN